MILGKVTGQVISTQKDHGLSGFKLLIVQDVKLADLTPSASYIVAVDAVGAGIGEYVLTVSGSSARMCAGLGDKPVDCTIVGIVDTVQLEGRTIYSKREQSAPVAAAAK